MKHAYASTNVVTIGAGQIVICLYGPRGGTQCTAELTRESAAKLMFELNRALRETEDPANPDPNPWDVSHNVTSRSD